VDQRLRVPTIFCVEIAALVGLVLMLAACTNGQPVGPISGTQDRKDPSFTNYVSMAPSLTELIYLLNGKEELIGVCSECDYPPEVKKKPKAGSFTTVDLEKVSMLHPDGVLLVNGQESIANTLKAHGIKYVILKNDSVSDVSANIKRLGRITHRSAMAMSLSAEYDKHVALIRNAIKNTKDKPRVFFSIWASPLLTVGPTSYLNDAITTCGGTNIAANLKGDYPHYSTERLLVEQPDVIILPHEADTQDFLKAAPWSSLKAVKEHRVYFLPEKDKDNLSRPTMRLVKGLYWLAEILHPSMQLR
jgi:iron complex transport system substrate-binding protein